MQTIAYDINHQFKDQIVAAHASRSPSASKRWMSCPGSIKLSEDIPFSSSYAAASGSIVHNMSEMLFKGHLENVSLSDYWLDKTEVYDDFEVTVTKDMIKCAETYVHYVETRTQELDGKLLIEEKLRIDEISEDCWGTGDAVIIGKKTNRIAVIDLKSGKFPVDVQDNTQLMIYGLGAASRYANENTTIELTIVQPLGFHKDGPIRSWDISATDLVDWGYDILKPAIDATFEEEPEFLVGEWCRFCPAGMNGKCKIYNNQLMEKNK